MTFSHVRPYIALILVLFFGTGCAGQATCDGIEGKLYRNTTKRESGLGADGQITFGTWTLQFERQTINSLSGNDYKRDAYGWSFSDYGQTGLYDCKKAVILLGDGYGNDALDEESVISAAYDLEADCIDLEGKTYVFDRYLNE